MRKKPKHDVEWRSENACTAHLRDVKEIYLIVVKLLLQLFSFLEDKGKMLAET